MTQRMLIDPIYNPELAAQEVVTELCKAQVFGIGPETQTFGSEDGTKIAEAIIATHKKLTEYYKTLAK